MQDKYAKTISPALPSARRKTAARGEKCGIGVFRNNSGGGASTFYRPALSPFVRRLLGLFQDHQGAVVISPQAQVEPVVHQERALKTSYFSTSLPSRLLIRYAAFSSSPRRQTVGAGRRYCWEWRKANKTACFPSAETY